MNKSPVFFDPSRRRSHYLNLLFFLLFISLIFAASSFFLGTFKKPSLPTPDFNNKTFAQGDNEEADSKSPKISGRDFSNGRDLFFTFAGKKKANPLNSDPRNLNQGDRSKELDCRRNQSVIRQPKRMAFYVDWDEKSLDSLRNNLDELDRLIPEWYYIFDNKGSIGIRDQKAQSQVSEYIKKYKSELKVTPLVSNYNIATDSWEGDKLQSMLDNPENRQTAVNNLFNLIFSNNYSGLVVNFKEISEDDNPGLDLFMKELETKFHRNNLTISQIVYLEKIVYLGRQPNYDVDFYILRAFDEHVADKKFPQAAAPQDWFDKSFQEQLSQLPPEKCIIALGNFGYDWMAGEETAKIISFQESVDLIKNSESKTALILDEKKSNSSFEYVDKNGKQHKVWLLDAISAFNQVSFASAYQPYGYALWRLGTEDPSIWQVFKNLREPDVRVAELLNDIPCENAVRYEGKGKISQLTSTPVAGSRRLKYDAVKKRISQGEIMRYPNTFSIKSWGYAEPQDKKIAVTFDDGPDDKYTPEILDILDKHQVKATFFVIGTNVLHHPDIAKRIIREGHTLGNHTFSHPDISRISLKQLAVELSTVQRIVEGYTNRKTVLFRSPFGEDSDPKTTGQLLALATLSDFNYFNVGIDIDPKDWKNSDPNAIVKEILNQAKNKNGGILLLHDGGGSRENTVAALSIVIPELEKEGFKIVSLADYVGVPEEQLMPRLSTNEKFYAYSSGATYSSVSWLIDLVKSLFLLGTILGIARSLFVLALATVQWKRSRAGLKKPSCLGTVAMEKFYRPLVSIIIPAFNEERVICKTIKSLLRSTYQNLEIILVDDGSTDNTYKKALDTFSGKTKISIFSIENGGKSNALNFGIIKGRGEIFVTLDADTIFQRDTVSKLIHHFEDPKVGAVAGNAKVGNLTNWLTKFQALEYITGQNLDRRAFDLINCITVVPGAIGAWRREAIFLAKGFSSHTLAEDADLTFSIIRNGFKVKFEDRALAFTEAPDTVGCFLKQRFRWMFGTLQTVWKHREASFRPRYKALGIFAIPNVLIFQIIFPFISPILDLTAAVSVGWVIWQVVNHPTGEYRGIESLSVIICFYLVFTVLDLTVSAAAFFFEKKENRRLLLLIFLQRLFYRQLMYYISIKTIYTAARGSRVYWNKLERKNTVEIKKAYLSEGVLS